VLQDIIGSRRFFEERQNILSVKVEPEAFNCPVSLRAAVQSSSLSFLELPKSLILFFQHCHSLKFQAHFILTKETTFNSSAFLVDAFANHDDKRSFIFCYDCICSLSVVLKHAH
jgi:hypothetical protein